MDNSREAEIQKIAYQLWLDEGRPAGRHLDHYFRAEAVWRQRQRAATAAAPGPAPARAAAPSRPNNRPRKTR